jgi:hypothetical protein
VADEREQAGLASHGRACFVRDPPMAPPSAPGETARAASWSSKVSASATMSHNDSRRSTPQARALPERCVRATPLPRAGSRTRCAGAAAPARAGPRSSSPSPARSRCDASSARGRVRSAGGRGSRSPRPRAPAAGSAGRRAGRYPDRIVVITDAGDDLVELAAEPLAPGYARDQRVPHRRLRGRRGGDARFISPASRDATLSGRLIPR